MTFVTNTYIFFGALCRGLNLKLLPIMINRRVLARVRTCDACKRLIVFAFKMHHQTEAMIVKMIQVKKSPINSF